MPLGANKWNAARGFYDRLTLGVDGDPTEQDATTQHGLDKRFPHYETFWRYHVCPATDRPNGITFRAGVADIISVIAQRSFTVLTYLLESLDYLTRVEQGELGPRNRNCYITIMFAGNALQVFTELQNALCGSPNGLAGMNDLATQLRVPIRLFPDWDTHWRPGRDLAVSYRNYLTHQGRFYTVFQQATRKTLVLKRIAFQPNVTYTWTQADNDYAAQPANWTTLTDACKDVFADTLDFLDRAYERTVARLDFLSVNPDYQRLWGWRDHQPVVSRPTQRAPLGGLATTPGWTMTGSTASGIDPKPPDSPPGSGDKVV